MFQLRDYQEEISAKAANVLQDKNIVYLAMQVRTGKTLTALNAAALFGANKVLFVTKKRAIESIKKDYNLLNPPYDLDVINTEQLPNVKDAYSVVISDEHHKFGAFPKHGKYAKIFKELFSKTPQIYLSGTPTPESYSQIYHQFWCSYFSPFNSYKNFYQWAKTFVTIKQRSFGYGMVNDYSNANNDLIKPIIEPYTITYTQSQAGFNANVLENVLNVKMKDSTYNLAKKLINDHVVVGKEKTIIADTAVKMQQKLHQIYSGTVKFEDGSICIFDTSKAELIKGNFMYDKIAIFYKFKAEFELLKEVFGNKIVDNLTDFNTIEDSVIALQIVAGREGISLAAADYLIFYNIDFSATSYWQGRDRLTTKERLSNTIYWVFSEGGIEHKIYKQVMNKKSYTSSVFKKDYGVKF